MGVSLIIFGPLCPECLVLMSSVQWHVLKSKFLLFFFLWKFVTFPKINSWIINFYSKTSSFMSLSTNKATCYSVTSAPQCGPQSDSMAVKLCAWTLLESEWDQWSLLKINNKRILMFHSEFPPKCILKKDNTEVLFSWHSVQVWRACAKKGTKKKNL